jgi:hypothetical protein
MYKAEKGVEVERCCQWSNHLSWLKYDNTKGIFSLNLTNKILYLFCFVQLEDLYKANNEEYEVSKGRRWSGKSDDDLELYATPTLLSKFQNYNNTLIRMLNRECDKSFSENIPSFLINIVQCEFEHTSYIYDTIFDKKQPSNAGRWTYIVFDLALCHRQKRIFMRNLLWIVTSNYLSRKHKLTYV